MKWLNEIQNRWKGTSTSRECQIGSREEEPVELAETLQNPNRINWLYKSPKIPEILKYPQELYLSSETLPYFNTNDIPNEFLTLLYQYRALRVKFMKFIKNYDGNYAINVDNTHAHISNIHSGEKLILTNLDNETFDSTDKESKKVLREQFRKFEELTPNEQSNLISLAKMRNMYEVILIDRATLTVNLVAHSSRPDANPINVLNTIINKAIIRIEATGSLKENCETFTQEHGDRLILLYKMLRKLSELNEANH